MPIQLLTRSPLFGCDPQSFNYMKQPRQIAADGGYANEAISTSPTSTNTILVPSPAKPRYESTQRHKNQLRVGVYRLKIRDTSHLLKQIDLLGEALAHTFGQIDLFDTGRGSG